MLSCVLAQLPWMFLCYYPCNQHQICRHKTLGKGGSLGKQKPRAAVHRVSFCDPGGIQTPDFKNRNLTFYSAELRGQLRCRKSTWFLHSNQNAYATSLLHHSRFQNINQVLRQNHNFSRLLYKICLIIAKHMFYNIFAIWRSPLRNLLQMTHILRLGLSTQRLLALTALGICITITNCFSYLMGMGCGLLAIAFRAFRRAIWSF